MAQFRILSLDGGGIRGAFGAAFLAEIEQKLGQPVSQYFDLIAGTSTGGIIATALSLGEPAERIRAFYQSWGEKIFARQPPALLPLAGWKGLLAKTFRSRIDKTMAAKFGLDSNDLLQTKYTSDQLSRALKEVFGSKTLENARTRLVVPAVDVARGETTVFKTPHLPDMTRDRVYAATDVVLATAAAPTYFPHAEIRNGSAYCDGGLWANNPSMVAYVEAMLICSKCRRPGVDPEFRPDEIHVLSIGTGRQTTSLEPPGLRAGLGWWARRLIDAMFLAQSRGIHWMSEHMLPGRHHRIDYDIPDAGWSLDRVDLLPRLFHFGREVAHAKFKDLRSVFFIEPAKPYTAFPPQ